MAGRIKHMERSHRSYGKNYAEFGRFEAKANFAKTCKESKKQGNPIGNLFNKFSNFFRKGER